MWYNYEKVKNLLNNYISRGKLITNIFLELI